MAGAGRDHFVGTRNHSHGKLLLSEPAIVLVQSNPSQRPLATRVIDVITIGMTVQETGMRSLIAFLTLALLAAAPLSATTAVAQDKKKTEKKTEKKAEKKA